MPTNRSIKSCGSSITALQNARIHGIQLSSLVVRQLRRFNNCGVRHPKSNSAVSWPRLHVKKAPQSTCTPAGSWAGGQTGHEPVWPSTPRACNLQPYFPPTRSPKRPPNLASRESSQLLATAPARWPRGAADHVVTPKQAGVLAQRPYTIGGLGVTIERRLLGQAVVECTCYSPPAVVYTTTHLLPQAEGLPTKA